MSNYREEVSPVPVLVVGNLLSKSNGVRSVCEDLSWQLERSGWDVVKTSTYLGRFRRLVDMVSTTFRYRNQYQVAQVNVYSGFAFVWAEAVCWTLRRLSKPYVLTLHGGNLPSFAKRWPGRVQALLGSAKYVTTPSHYLLEQMSSYCERIEKLPNALDLSQYEYRYRPTPSPKLVWLRSFHRIYNPALAPKVLFEVLREFPEAELTMIGPDRGDGSLQETKAAVSELGLDSRVHLVGGVAKSEVSRWLNVGDILLNTTDFDNTPISLMEAMACGLCVVTTNVGGIPYLVQNEQNALMVPPNDAPSMSAAVLRCLRDRQLASQLSRHGRETVEKFDWPVVLPQWKSVLARACDKPKHHN